MIAIFALAAGLALADAAVPDALAAPGETTLTTLHAVGAQIYECKADDAGALAWKFREPIAALMGAGKTVGRHYAGPSWALDDGGLVVGKVVATAPGETAKDAAWLKLTVVSRRGAGLLDGATTIQRIDTHGGQIAGACETEGVLRAVPYAADYVFLKK